MENERIIKGELFLAAIELALIAMQSRRQQNQPQTQ